MPSTSSIDLILQALEAHPVVSAGVFAILAAIIGALVSALLDFRKKGSEFFAKISNKVFSKNKQTVSTDKSQGSVTAHATNTGPIINVNNSRNVKIVMPERGSGIASEDDALNLPPSGSSIPEQDGLYSLGLNNEQIETISNFFNGLYQKLRSKSPSRQLTRDARALLQGAIFALGTKDRGNVEWKEHCSSSLREIIHEWYGNGGDFASDFREFFPNSPKSSETDVYRLNKLNYQYFSGVAHHDATGIRSALMTIKGVQTLKLEDCYSDENFLEVTKSFFDLALQLIAFSEQTAPEPPPV